MCHQLNTDVLINKCLLRDYKITLKYLKSETLVLEDLARPLLITYDNKLGTHPNSSYFINTLKKHNWDYMIVSMNDTYSGHTDKLKGYREALTMVPSDKVVVFSDAHDVVCCRDSKAFIKGFESFNTGVIISLELFCDTTTDVVIKPAPQCIPLTKFWKYHKFTTWPLRKYVNSGLIAGRAKNLIHYFDFAIEGKFKDDQEAAGHWMNKYPERVKGDYDAKLLHTTNFAKSCGLENVVRQSRDSPTFAELFGRSSFFLHFPSLKTKGQTLMYEFTKKMIDAGASAELLNSIYGYTMDMCGWEYIPNKC